MSLPARGAWIEIKMMRTVWLASSRSPRGERGLKSREEEEGTVMVWTLPARGAWIEMMWRTARRTAVKVAPREGSVD